MNTRDASEPPRDIRDTLNNRARQALAAGTKHQVVADAEAFIRAAAVGAMNSPDLTAKDRVQVARAIRDRYREYKAAVLGERGLTVPKPPVLAVVARTAHEMDDSPTTVGQLFPAGEY